MLQGRSHHNKNKTYIKKDISNMNPRSTSRERSPTRTQDLPQERGYQQQEHKDFLKREDFNTKITRINPREMSPTIPRTSGKIPTKAQGQNQNQRGGERDETQNSEIHEAKWEVESVLNNELERLFYRELGHLKRWDH